MVSIGRLTLAGEEAALSVSGTRLVTGFIRLVLAFCLVLAVIMPEYGFTQDLPGYEQTEISLRISQIGVADVGVYMKGEALYLPVTGLFTFLQIDNIPSPGYDSVTGFFIRKEALYVIDRVLNRIQFNGKTFALTPGDLIRTETNLYLRSEYFGKVFGLKFDFDFASLSAILVTNVELPVIRELRLSMMRHNLRRIRDEIKADTNIGRRYPLFHFGMADWAFVSTQEAPGNRNIFLNAVLGAVIAGGEANVTLNYSNASPFNEKQQFYLWHYANNDNHLLRQVLLGKIPVQATSTIVSSLAGVQFTNSPTTYRRSFGSYTISDYTQPGWGVELYVNNVLVDYLKADASGFYTFDVPLVYGNSVVMLRFYGPWGEERSRQQNISIPFNFLPSKKLEYLVSAAMVEDSRHSAFARAILNYGLNNHMTASIGTEYLSSVTHHSIMPFLNFSLRIGPGLLVTSEYAPGIRFKSILSYSLPCNLHFDFNYTRFQQDQKAILTSVIEDRKLVISMPLHKNMFTSLVRFTIDQMSLQQSKYLTSELLISGCAYGVSANFTTIAMIYNPVRPYVYSALSFGFRLPARIIITPQAQFDYRSSRIVSVKVECEKQIFDHGALKLSYENNFDINLRNIQVGLRYVFPFAQTSASANLGNTNASFVQTARGSLLYDGKTKLYVASNLTGVGKGGIVIRPFLDLNNNGKRDPGEERVSGLSIHMSGGRIEQDKRDSSIRIFDLEPFTGYFIETDRSSFDNVAWQVRKPVISVTVDPNQFKLVEVPVSVLGEASGTVYLANAIGKTGQGRIIVSFFRSDSSLDGRTVTEPDGYFSFLGLGPGSYRVMVNAEQLSKLNFSVSPVSIPFVIAMNRDGDQVQGLDFELRANPVPSSILNACAVEPGQAPAGEKKAEQDNDQGRILKPD